MTQYTRQTIINDALQSFSVCRADAERAESDAERLECLERADFWLELITDLELEAEQAGEVSPAETAREAAEQAAQAAGYWDAAEHAHALAEAALAAEWAAMGELEAQRERGGSLPRLGSRGPGPAPRLRPPWSRSRG